jgi:hypothetical protein
MRFGKKLALAMIRDADEAPYISQKELKHQLVGLEKLCRSYMDQLELLSHHSQKTNLEELAEKHRLSYDIPPRSGLLELNEIVIKDAKLFTILLHDVEKIRRYVEICEVNLMLSINGWLLDAENAQTIVGKESVSVAYRPDLLAASIIGSSFPDSFHVFPSQDLVVMEFDRLKQYMEVNLNAIKKLVQRRNKNVPECFWSRDNFDDMFEIRTPEFQLLETRIHTLRNMCS